MPRVAPVTHQQTLDSLRRVRRQLYAIPEAELSAMSLDDQVKYGNALSDLSVAVLKMETLKLKNVNKNFKSEEQNLHAAAHQLESDLHGLKYFTDVVRVASDGLALVTKVVGLV